VNKQLSKLPGNVQKRFYALVKLLGSNGPASGHVFQNYSKLSENEYHCHLTYHYVACWRHEKETIIIEVYYVGSRENAPY
jgi:mRNA-degrading endonuclease RelE of RelBE toxin-antitoxin system